MGKKSFVERFRSKNIVDIRTAEKWPSRQRPRGIIIAAPPKFIKEVCRVTRGRHTLMVALYLYHRTCICKSQMVTLPSGLLATFGVTPRTKQRALARLQAVGLVELERANGRTTRVTLLWPPPD